MKVKYTIDRNESNSKRDYAIQKLMHELGGKVTVSDNEIQVDSYDESKVCDILNRSGVRYSKG